MGSAETFEQPSVESSDGATKQLRVLLMGGSAIRDRLGAASGGIADLIASNYGDRIAVTSVSANLSRSDCIVSALQGPAIEEGTFPPDFVASQSASSLLDAELDVVVLSVSTSFNDNARRLKSGRLIELPTDWRIAWTEDQIDWVDNHTEAIGMVNPQTANTDLKQIIDAVSAASGARVLIYMISSSDPHDETHNFNGAPDSFSVLAHRMNLALIDVSETTGACLVDADRILSETGTRGLVEGPGQYSPEAHALLADEVVRILEDQTILDPQGKASVNVPLTVVLPEFDRRVKDGTIVKWYKGVGDSISYGDRMFDFETDPLTWTLEQKPKKKFGKRKARRAALMFRFVAADNGVLRRISVAEGERQVLGQSVGLVTHSETDPLDASDGTADFRVVAQIP